MDFSISAFEKAIKEEGVKQYLLKLTLITVIYILTAGIGLSLAGEFDQITTIWPPSGVAITALLLWGIHYWPGIFVGAFIANSLTGVSQSIATGIGIGNTLEAVIAILLIKRYVENSAIFEKITSIMWYVALGPFFGSIVAASIGVSSLFLGNVLRPDQVSDAWITWWVGDMIGALVIVPFVVAWSNKSYREQLSGHVYESVALALLVTITSTLIFTQSVHTALTTLPLVYIIFPIIMLAAVRFMQIGAVTAGMIITTAAIWGTLKRRGPFTISTSNAENLFALHFFILVVIFTAFILSIAVYARMRSEQAQAKQADELEKARQQILANISKQKDLQEQMHDATYKINSILTGIFDEKPPANQQRRRKS